VLLFGAGAALLFFVYVKGHQKGSWPRSMDTSSWTVFIVNEYDATPGIVGTRRS